MMVFLLCHFLLRHSQAPWRWTVYAHRKPDRIPVYLCWRLELRKCHFHDPGHHYLACHEPDEANGQGKRRVGGRYAEKRASFFQKFYVVICLVFFYLPILVTMIFSFNSSKSLTKFTGFSMRWYTELLHNTEVSKAVYVSVTIAILATVISTILGTITAIGLSKSRRC